MEKSDDRQFSRDSQYNAHEIKEEEEEEAYLGYYKIIIKKKKTQFSQRPGPCQAQWPRQRLGPRPTSGAREGPNLFIYYFYIVDFCCACLS
jgi:hypothetical protein